MHIEPGYCHCGCGGLTKLAVQSSTRSGWVKGQPHRYLLGHHNRNLVPNPAKIIIDPQSACHIWTGSLTGDGYGQVVLHGVFCKVHSWFYEQQFGPVPNGLELDHLCRRRACCNPEHLEPVTSAVNSQRGSRAKLTLESVLQIRQLMGFEKMATVADMFSVHRSTISRIWNEKNWVIP